MKDTNLFELATRTKMRFPFRGMISVEDLWDLTPESLDSVFKTLNSEIKQVKEESLLNTKSKADETLEMQIEIVKYIVGVKLAEAEVKKAAKDNREKKQKIMEILSSKQDEDLQNKTPEELMEMLDKLQ